MTLFYMYSMTLFYMYSMTLSYMYSMTLFYMYSMMTLFYMYSITLFCMYSMTLSYMYSMTDDSFARDTIFRYSKLFLKISIWMPLLYGFQTTQAWAYRNAPGHISFDTAKRFMSTLTTADWTQKAQEHRSVGAPMWTVTCGRQQCQFDDCFCGQEDHWADVFTNVVHPVMSKRTVLFLQIRWRWWGSRTTWTGSA